MMHVMLKTNSGFLERICRRVRRKMKSRVQQQQQRGSHELAAEQGAGRLEDSSASDSAVSSVAVRCAAVLEPCCRSSLQDSIAYAVVPRIVTTTTTTTTTASPESCMHQRITSSAPPHLNAGSDRRDQDGLLQKSDYADSRDIRCKITTDTTKNEDKPKEIFILSPTDSGLYSEEESEEEYLDVFSDDDDGEEEHKLVDDGWRIPAEEVALDKVMVSNHSETIYSGYWHGNVAVHARYSNSDETYRSILADVSTLTNIRHENIQLFLGVCHDLHSDYITIVMDHMKGQSLHSLIHKQNHKFNFQSLTKIMSQVAQGLEYLHDKGIPHPLLTTMSVTLHYRVCISMLSSGSASMGVVNATDLPYLPPEVMRTISQHSSSGQTGLTCPSSPHSVRGLQSRSGSTSGRHTYNLPSTTGWSSPTSPSLRNIRRQVDSNGYLCAGGPSSSSIRGSCDDLRNDVHSRKRVQLKGDTTMMHTFQTNVFSFGTMLYEMLTRDKPFSSTPGNLIIYQVGRGSTYPLDNSLRDGKFKQIIKKCWRKDPNTRPSFQELLSTIEQNVSPKSCGLNKSHFSFSVPSQLDKIGCMENGGLDR